MNAKQLLKQYEEQRSLLKDSETELTAALKRQAEIGARLTEVRLACAQSDREREALMNSTATAVEIDANLRKSSRERTELADSEAGMDRMHVLATKRVGAARRAIVAAENIAAEAHKAALAAVLEEAMGAFYESSRGALERLRALIASDWALARWPEHGIGDLAEHRGGQVKGVMARIASGIETLWLKDRRMSEQPAEIAKADGVPSLPVVSALLDGAARALVVDVDHKLLHGKFSSGDERDLAAGGSTSREVSDELAGDDGDPKHIYTMVNQAMRNEEQRHGEIQQIETRLKNAELHPSNRRELEADLQDGKVLLARAVEIRTHWEERSARLREQAEAKQAA